jgi:uncharacterized membrane-anchored protein
MEKESHNKDWKMKKNYLKLIIFIVILLVGFGVSILYLSWPLITGKTYVLKTAPVDPFDVFRGQYLIIGYEISRISNISDVSKYVVGQEIYVKLEQDSSGISHPIGISLEKPENNFIRGKITNFGSNSLVIEYGIENFFFEKEATFPTQNMTVEVKVSDFGKARISKILQNGKPLNMTYNQNIYS